MTPDLLRICQEEASYLVFRRRVPLDVEDLTQAAAVFALESRAKDPALIRVIARRRLRNVVRSEFARPGPSRMTSLPAEYGEDAWVPEPLREAPSSFEGLCLSQVLARRAKEAGGALTSPSTGSAAARYERAKAVLKWYNKNPRPFDIVAEGAYDSGVVG